MERPDQLSAAHVVAANILGLRLLDETAVAVAAAGFAAAIAADNHDVSNHERRIPRKIWGVVRGVPVERHPAVIAEVGEELPRVEVHGIEVFAAAEEDTLVIAARSATPVRRASRALAGGLLQGRGERLLNP